MSVRAPNLAFFSALSLASRIGLALLLTLPARCAFAAPAVASDVPQAAANRREVVGSGHVVEQPRPISGVWSVTLASEGRVRVEQGDHEALIIRAEDNLLPHITTEVRNGTLTIGADVELEPTEPIEYLLTVRELEEATLQGAGQILCDRLDTERLTLGLFGAGLLRFRGLEASTLEATIAGVGDIQASGVVDRQETAITGVGSLFGSELHSTTAEVRITGVGEATVRVRDRLRAVITGIGTIWYLGNPRLESTITGEGEVIRLEGSAPDWLPADLGDGWPISTPEEQGIDSAVVERIMEAAATDPRLDTIYSVLLVRHGTLVAEGYFNGRYREQTNEIRSATKSFTSLLVGIAMEQGLVASVDQTLFDLLPVYADLLVDPDKRRLTLEDALTMRLGLRWEENSSGFRWSEWPADLVRFTLEQSVVEPPGTRFRYSSGDSQVLAKVVTTASGQELQEFARRHLFAPLGIEQTSWMRHDDGSHYGGVGLYIRPRDMAKIGQLALQKGRWETSPGRLRQIVPRAWMETSTLDHVEEPVGLLGGYGYQWWVDPEQGHFAAIGHGGQWITVLPDEDVVLVVTADPTVGPDDSIDVNAITEHAEDFEIAAEPGRVGFPADRYTVNAGDDRIVLPVRRTGGVGGAVKVAYEVVAGSARPGEDYEPVSGVLGWLAGESGARHLEVKLLDDGRREGEETFEVRIEVLTGSAALGRATATVAIVEDGGPSAGRAGRLECEQETYSGREGDVVTVAVRRSEGDEGEVSVRWATADRSARAGSDYEAASGLLTWPDGDVSPRQVEIRLYDDALAERSELVELRLFEPTGGAVVNGGEEARVVVAVLDADQGSVCTPGDDALCLSRSRFRVEAEWQDPTTGETGFGTALSGTEETGTFWFFDAENLELVVKVLDGRPLNGAHWLFYGALSDVEYWLVATDTWTGDAAVYHNPPGNFCGNADTRAFPDAGDGTLTPLAPLDAGISFPTLDATDTGDCSPSEEALCLLGGRFRVTVRWHDPNSGERGEGRVLAGGEKTGLFWFFGADNVELIVKALDGTPINGRYWIYYGALSDVEYWISVRDTVTGAVRQYHNEPGNYCGQADSGAFAE